jgi:hypothetical protein
MKLPIFGRLLTWFLIWILCAAFGCGGREARGPAVRIQLQFPEVLKRSNERFERFLSRSESLQVRWETRSGRSGEKRFSMRALEGVAVEATGFPEDPQDVLRIQAWIWDKTREGEMRSVPVLTGEGRISAHDFSKDSDGRMVIRMSLHVSVKEYD